MKNQFQPEKIIATALTIPKEEFIFKLNDRIKIGIELHNREIQFEDDYSKLKSLYSKWHNFNLELLKQSFNKENNEYKIKYSQSGEFSGIIKRNPNRIEEISNLRIKIKYKIEALQGFIEISDLLKVGINSQSNPNQEVKADNTNTEVFIVHGHDEEAKIKTARFIEKLGFQPIILHEQVSSSKTVIEKIEHYSNVGFGVVLYTPCDIGAKDEQKPQYKNRARQNVVFEHGFLMAKIGRQNVCALVKGDIETPNDISGVVYVKMDSEDAWQIKLAKEMKSSGYDIDMNKL